VIALKPSVQLSPRPGPCSCRVAGTGNRSQSDSPRGDPRHHLERARRKCHLADRRDRTHPPWGREPSNETPREYWYSPGRSCSPRIRIRVGDVANDNQVALMLAAICRTKAPRGIRKASRRRVSKTGLESSAAGRRVFSAAAAVGGRSVSGTRYSRSRCPCRRRGGYRSGLPVLGCAAPAPA